MQVKIVNGDVESLANMLNSAIADSYEKGQQAERERIKNVIAELLEPADRDPWIHYSTLLERIDAVE